MNLIPINYYGDGNAYRGRLLSPSSKTTYVLFNGVLVYVIEKEEE